MERTRTRSISSSASSKQTPLLSYYSSPSFIPSYLFTPWTNMNDMSVHVLPVIPNHMTIFDTTPTHSSTLLTQSTWPFPPCLHTQIHILSAAIILPSRIPHTHTHNSKRKSKRLLGLEPLPVELLPLLPLFLSSSLSLTSFISFKSAV